MTTNQTPQQYDKLWLGVLAELQLQMSKAVYATCFSKTTLASLSDSVATINCPNPMISQLIEKRYYSLLKSIVDHRTGQSVSLAFTASAPSSQQTQVGPLFTQADTPVRSSAQVAKKFGLAPEYTFDTFAVSSTNQMAYAAATAIANDPGRAYNPLLLYGGVGVGKTHLMQAIGHAIVAHNSAARAVFCMGDEFTNEIIAGIQNKTTQAFKQKYRRAQLLLVDDIQFIAGKQTVQEEFFHTFNAIRQEGGQIVLTSDKPPGEIFQLEERLRSRFEAGLIIDIGQPDFELRAAITNIKAGVLGLALATDITQMIAANVTTARGIEGFLQRLKSEVLLKNTAVTPEIVAGLLGHRKAEVQVKRNVSAQQVIGAVCGFYDLKKAVLRGRKRNRPIARPRQVTMYLCKTELGLTLSDIGKLLGGRDHSTVLHGVETITGELSTNEHLRVDVERIKQRLWG